MSIPDFQKKLEQFPISMEVRLIAKAWIEYIIEKSKWRLTSVDLVGKSVVAEWDSGMTVGFTPTGELLIRINEDRPELPRANSNYTRVDASVNCVDLGKTISKNR